MSNVLPPESEYEALAPRPGSPVWRAFNDVRLFAAAGYATLLQVAHPTVGHGVHQYSSFTKDPWGRLLRTLDYVNGTVYGGPELAGDVGRRVRVLHKSIKGRRPDGSRFHAMEPDAFAWVHATLAKSVVLGRRHFATPMSEREKEEFWDEWVGVGRLVGVRPSDLPERWSDFRDYFDTTVDQKLEWTPAVPEVLDTLERTGPPGLPRMPRPLWDAVRRPMVVQLRVTTVGLLPARLRDRLGLSYTRADQAAFAAVAAGSRAARPLVRGRLAAVGPEYVRMRRAALERGDVAGGRSAPRKQPATV